MIGKTVSHYKILDRLSTGAMGDVYLAEDEQLHRKVVIKLLPEAAAADPEQRERFLQEARTHAKLSHSRIAMFLEVGEHENRPFLVSEYVEGRTLAEVAGSDKLTLSEALDLIIQAAEGLQAAHAQGVVHRDIKPTNLMITPDGGVKILDFGLARLKDASRITLAKPQASTVAFMSPEQATGKEVDHRSDIFSLGVVLYQLVCGRPPFEGDSEQAIIESILQSQPQPMARYSRDVPADLEQVVSKCMAKDPGERYQSISDLLADLKRIKRTVDSGVSSGSGLTVRRRRTPALLTVIGVVLIAVLLVIFNPFNWKIVPDRGAEAADNQLAVMYFDNLADPEDADRTSDVLTSLLITSLSESEFLKVVNRQRLLDVLRQLGHGGSRFVDQSVAVQVAEATRARYLVTGEIIQNEPSLVITANVSVAESGVNVSSHRLISEPEDDVFSLVDRLSAAIRNGLSLPEEAQRESVVKSAQVSTSSPEAYRHYLEGLDSYWSYEYKPAVASFRKALEYDSTFAMAHYRLAVLAWESGELPLEEHRGYIEKAMRFREGATWKEQTLIRARMAYADDDRETQLRELREFVERDPGDKEGYYELASGLCSPSWPEAWPEGVRALEKVIELDPYFKPAYADLAALYTHHGDNERALWAINQYISLAPDEANAYSTRGGYYMSAGRFADAIQSFRRALEVDPSLTEARTSIGGCFVRMRDFEGALREYRIQASHPDLATRSWGRLSLAYVALYRGQFSEGLELLDQGIAADKIDGASDLPLMWKHYCKSRALTELGRLEEAMKELRLCQQAMLRLTKSTELGWRVEEVDLYARSGDDRQADSVLEVLRARIPAPNSEEEYWIAEGLAAQARGDWSRALVYYDSGHTAIIPNWRFYSLYLYGRACLTSGQLGEAAELLGEIPTNFGQARFTHPFWLSKAHYYLGIAYEESGWDQRAIEQYEIFLDIWSVADPDQTIVDDARRRLAGLKS